MASAERSTQAPVQPGDTLDGKYLIIRAIGAGAMGVVLAARHVELGQIVAIKLLAPEAADEASNVERILREAKAVAQLKGEHVARVFDVGRLDDERLSAWGGMPYIVMEYLEGEDLARIARRGPMSIEDAATYVHQACDALEEAHRLGIVHRDIKPANLFLTRRPNGAPLLKVLDFGISKMTAAFPADENLTASTVMLGTPKYMAPEQLRATRAADPRTDIWALGVVLYRLLSGRTPFLGATFPELCAQVLMETPPRLRELRPEVPPEFDALVMRCLQKDPARRFLSAAALAAALAPFVPSAGMPSSLRLGQMAHDDIGTLHGSVATYQRGEGRRRSNRRSFLIGFGVALPLLLGAVSLWSSRAHDAGVALSLAPVAPAPAVPPPEAESTPERAGALGGEPRPSPDPADTEAASDAAAPSAAALPAKAASTAPSASTSSAVARRRGVRVAPVQRDEDGDDDRERTRK